MKTKWSSGLLVIGVVALVVVLVMRGNRADSARAGDDKAFRFIFDRHAPSVRRFLQDLLRDGEAADEGTQEVFVRAHSRLRSLRDQDKLQPWLFGIARHVLSGHRRSSVADRDKQRRIEGRRLLDEEDVDRLVERIDAQQNSHRVYAALAALPEGERAIFELVALDGLVPAEAAAALGIRAATGRVRLHRARRTLRAALADLDPAAAARLSTALTDTGEDL